MNQHEARRAWHRWADSRAERERAALAADVAPVGNAWRYVPGATEARPGDELVGGYTLDQWRALMAWTHRTRGEVPPWEATTTRAARSSTATRYGTR